MNRMDPLNRNELDRVYSERKKAEAAGDFKKAEKLLEEEKKLKKYSGTVFKYISEPLRLRALRKKAEKGLLPPLLACLFAVWHLYELFINKRILFPRRHNIHVDVDNVFFWIYGAFLVSTIILICTFLFRRFNTRQKAKSGE
ncbi:MAG: hypothetical protein HQL21_03210 [Candidatus Omnitrophica bacterium]|nr:hypothetical protein [Candidatus Omnitrophota bacterium]